MFMLMSIEVIHHGPSIFEDNLFFLSFYLSLFHHRAVLVLICKDSLLLLHMR